MRASLLCVATLTACAARASLAFLNLNQPCPGFKCGSSALTAVPRKDFVFTANGCGTAALPIHTETDFTECCNWHDACYSTCGIKKASCEKRLDKCMRAVCVVLTDAEARDKCETTAQLFALGAQMVACPAFQQAQKDACECFPKAKAEHANRQRLVHFLTENDAPEKDRKPEAVEALLKKYKGQEPKMFLRLLKKYPDAIKEDTTRANFMDELFKAPEGDHGGKKDSVAVGLDEPNDEPVDEHIEL